MEWHWCFWGEWHGPYTLQRINELTATLPNQFLMASGGTDEELDELRTFPRLGGLAIVSRHVTPRAVSTLRSFPELRELILCGPPITDEFLSAVTVLPSLESMTLIHTACTAKGVRKFVGFVPRCKVYRAGADAILPAVLRRELQLFLPET
jgi:hypothetical protein